MRPGDWACPSCDAVVFASKDTCFKCGAAKPQQQEENLTLTLTLTLTLILTLSLTP